MLGVFSALLTEEGKKMDVQSLVAFITLGDFSQLHFHQQFVWFLLFSSCYLNETGVSRKD